MSKLDEFAEDLGTPTVTRAEDAQRLAWIGGTVHTVVMDGASTGGRLSVLRSTFALGTGAPVHVHPAEDETLYVLDGSLVIWAGADKWTVNSGDTVFLPRAVPHSYAVTSHNADVITVCTPSGMEKFFRTAGWDLSKPIPEDWDVDMAALPETAAKSGQIVLGAPLGAVDSMPDELTSWAMPG